MRDFRIKGTVYHGTICEIDQVDLRAGRGYKDFGRGFYLAYNKTQAIGVANKNYKLADRRQEHVARNLYAFDTLQSGFDKCETKVFQDADEEWLDFILMCRKSGSTPHNFDVVVGPTADDDDTSMCLNMYWEGVYGAVGSSDAKQTLLRNLEVENLGIQVFIGTEKGLSILCNKRKLEVWNGRRKSTNGDCLKSNLFSKI